LKKVGRDWRVDKRAMQIFDLGKLNLRNLKFAALQNLLDLVDINKSWETVTENIQISAIDSTGYYKLKQHKPWFDERFSIQLEQNI
jgi:hypothetical protein